MREKVPGGVGQGRRAANMICENCFRYQALCRLIFLQYFIGTDFEPVLSLRLDSALKALEDLEEERRGGPVRVGVVVRGIMEDLALRRIDLDYLGAEYG
jgi:hypothetical protein